MVTKKTTAGKKAVSKLKLRKESIRTLEVRNSASVKGGASGDCSGLACLPTRKAF